MKKKPKKIKSGYVLIYKPSHKYSQTKNGWIFEHRAIVEDFIKRSLKKGECIHHIDENKQNNNIENLMLFKNHGEHSSFHNKVKQFGFTNPILKQIEENRLKKVRILTGSKIANMNCIICGKEVDKMLFCNKCRKKDVFLRIKAFKNSKYYK